MDFRDESVIGAESELITQTEVSVGGSPRSSEPSSASLEITSDGGGKPLLDKSITFLSSGSQSSTDSYDTVFEPGVRASDASANNSTVGRISNPKHVAHNSSVSLEDLSFSVRSSYEASDAATRESISLSPRHCPPLQVMDRSAGYDPGRISSSVFTANSTPQEWSVASNESLFSLHVGNISFNKEGILVLGAPSQKSFDEVKSNRPCSLVAVNETRRVAVDEGEQHARRARTENGSQDLITVQKITEHMDQKAPSPDISWNHPKNEVKIQPFPPPVKKKSSCCKTFSCCLHSCSSFSCCCKRPKCHCKMQRSCSCRSCSLSWCCSWNCCSKKNCCTNWNCCPKSSCCPKGSCCPNCSHCLKALCCWRWSCWKLFCCGNWGCWKLFCCWNWGCWKTCCRSWSCCSKGSCCKSWNCCSKEACCCNLNCCSRGPSCGSWGCCSKGSCCGGDWGCCSKGSCCKRWNCCSCSSWTKGSCCPTWDCCSKGKCCSNWGSCCQDWKCCSTGLCCFSSSAKPGEGQGRSENAQHYKTKKLGKSGVCRWLCCTCC